MCRFCKNQIQYFADAGKQNLWNTSNIPDKKIREEYSRIITTLAISQRIYLCYSACIIFVLVVFPFFVDEFDLPAGTLNSNNTILQKFYLTNQLVTLMQGLFYVPAMNVMVYSGVCINVMNQFRMMRLVLKNLDYHIARGDNATAERNLSMVIKQHIFLIRYYSEVQLQTFTN